MRSERSIGWALARAFAETYQRKGVIVSTKGGFISFDGQPPADPAAYFQEHYFAKGLCSPDKIAAGCHCVDRPFHFRHAISEKTVERDAQRSIQFVRSSSGVTTALVGMKQLEPLHGNLWSVRVSSAASEKLIGLFGRQESK